MEISMFELFAFSADYAKQHKKQLDAIREQIKDKVNSTDPEDWLTLPRLMREYLSTWELFADQAAKEKLYKENEK